MYRYTFRLKPGRDDDLIRWLEPLGEGERSFHIRQALRRGLNGRATPFRVPVVTESPRPVVQEVARPASTAAGDDIEKRLDRLAESF